MGRRRFLHSAILVLTTSAAVAILATAAWAAGTPQVIYSFAGEDDGEYTDTDLVIDSAGNLYGTSVQGGDFGGGTVFQLSPSGTGWTHTVLYSFTGGADGGSLTRASRSTARAIFTAQQSPVAAAFVKAAAAWPTS